VWPVAVPDGTALHRGFWSAHEAHQPPGSPSLTGRPFIEARTRAAACKPSKQVAVPDGTALHRGGVAWQAML